MKKARFSSLKNHKMTLQLVDYSEKAFAVVGDTKQIKDTLQSLGGRYNPHLKCGKGWIFSKKRLSSVENFLRLKLNASSNDSDPAAGMVQANEEMYFENMRDPEVRQSFRRCDIR
jgi:hypothetical protein